MPSFRDEISFLVGAQHAAPHFSKTFTSLAGVKPSLEGFVASPTARRTKRSHLTAHFGHSEPACGKQAEFASEPICGSQRISLPFGSVASANHRPRSR
jgi:hypothetical protein